MHAANPNHECCVNNSVGIFKMTKNNGTLTDLIMAFKLISGDLMILYMIVATFMALMSTAVFYAEVGVESVPLLHVCQRFELAARGGCKILCTATPKSAVKPAVKPTSLQSCEPIPHGFLATVWIMLTLAPELCHTLLNGLKVWTR
jgi:hypothetical protein